jgi:choline dehydrogenase
MAWRLKPGVPSLNPAFRGLGLVRSLLSYLLFKTGPMTSPPAEFGAYLKSDPAMDRPDLQVFGLPVTGDASPKSASGNSAQAAQAGKPKAPTPDGFLGMTLAPYQLRPHSRGSVTLNSARMEDPPVLKMNYLHDERDRRVLLWGLRFLREVARQPALAALVEAPVRPDAQVQTDDEWLSWLAPHLSTGYHPVGTCRMGRAGDPLAVCTPDLKVRGVQGLRVVDASSLPKVTSGNTAAPVYMLAERIAVAYAGGESSAAAVVGEVESAVDLSRLLQEAGFHVVSFRGAGLGPWLWKSMLLAATKPLS